ncbi:VOC family protein [Niabella drilacis]|uniref:Lactoylglutathione lyase n=1 Tax=Niabella drilacis (strain DSM 25811 / CCM 8410 / CCUG 62505 / LMG 26954 / E90) TaxID=1285928 RepID=A0A1G6KY33_NIADE|nr:VOC family protein [Niabella drilacis]SDC35286.1 lactoylglutathione lyase [Niabella drilacis]
MKKIQSTLILIFFSAMSLYAQESKKAVVLSNHQAIYVTDLKKAAAFYAHIIGLEQVDEPFKIGKHAWFRTGPKTTLHIILGADKPKEYFKNNHMCFSVPSLEDFIRKLDQNKVPYEDVNGKLSAVTNRVDGVKQIWLRDPDNYWIEINNDPSMFR